MINCCDLTVSLIIYKHFDKKNSIFCLKLVKFHTLRSFLHKNRMTVTRNFPFFTKPLPSFKHYGLSLYQVP